LVTLGVSILLAPFKFLRMSNNTDFTIENYLVGEGWKINNRVWRKGNKSLSVLNNGLMIALNNKIGIKHKHIVTCELPNNINEAEIIFKKCRLNFNYKKDDTSY
jgi:hypothetical protein